MLTRDQDLPATHPGQTIVGDKGYVSKHLDALARVGQRILALTTAIWHNRRTGTPITRPLTKTSRLGALSPAASGW